MEAGYDEDLEQTLVRETEEVKGGGESGIRDLLLSHYGKL